MTRRNTMRSVPIALAAVGVMLAGCSDDQPAPASDEPATTSASPSTPTSGEVLTLPGASEGTISTNLAAGRYRVPLGKRLAFEIDLPQGSSVDGDGLYIDAGDTIVKAELADEKYGIPSEPCTGYAEIAPTGPGVADLVTAVRDEPLYQVSEPRPVEVNGARGQRLEIRIPAAYDASACVDSQVGLPGNPASSNNMQPGYLGHWWILDVDGQRVVLQTYCAGCDDEAAARMDSTIEAIAFTAAP